MRCRVMLSRWFHNPEKSVRFHHRDQKTSNCLLKQYFATNKISTLVDKTTYKKTRLLTSLFFVSYFLKIDTPPLYKRVYPCFIFFLVCFILELSITTVLTSRTYFFFFFCFVDFLMFCFLIFLNFWFRERVFILFLFLSFFGHRPRQKNLTKKHPQKNTTKKSKKKNKKKAPLKKYLKLIFDFWLQIDFEKLILKL